MATKIRMARAGAKKRPYYHIVVADSRSPRDGRFIEKVGAYNPNLNKDDENRVQLNEGRITEWLSKGAVPSERVAIFLNKANVGTEFKAVKTILKKRDNVIALKKAEIEARKAKEEAERKAKEEAEKAEAEAAAKAEAEAKAAEEASSDESKDEAAA